MTNAMNKLVVITGPTASGKSDLAIALAKEFNGEIISADSRQVYRKMDIGTGKVPGFWDEQKKIYMSGNIPHYLIDIADPNEDFNVSHFKKIAQEKILEISTKGKIPIICGGTGFWIDALIYDTNLPEVSPDQELRKKLEKESCEEIFKKLKVLDPERAANIDSQNKFRLIRAIEIINKLGKVPLENKKKSPYDLVKISLDVSREILNKKIKKRLEIRFDEGMIAEVENLHKDGISWEKLESFGLEYRNIAQYLQKKMQFEEMKEKLYFDIIHFAKRQMTWLRRDQNILWLKDIEEISKEIKIFLNK